MPQEKLWTRDFILLMVTATFMYVSTFMFNPTLPLYIRTIGLTDPSLGGFIVFAYTVGSLLPRIFWGNLADRWTRIGVYVIGLVLITLGTPLFSIFTTMAGIIGIRLLQGIGFSATSTSASAMSVDLVPASRRAEGIGYYALANTMGMAFSPALGLYMLQHHGNAALLATGVAAGVLAIGSSMLVRYEKRRRLAAREGAEAAADGAGNATTGGDASGTGGTRTGTGSPRTAPAPKRGFYLEARVLKTSLISFFVVFPYGGIMGYIASYGRDLGIAEIGLYFTVYAIAVFIVRLFVGKLSDRYGTPAVLIPGILSMAVGLVLLFWATSLPLFLVSAVLFGFGFGTAVPILQVIAFTFAPADRRGAVGATLFATMDLAYGFGAIFLGMGIKYFGYRMAFVGSAAVLIIGLALFATVLLPVLRASGKESGVSAGSGSRA